MSVEGNRITFSIRESTPDDDELDDDDEDVVIIYYPADTLFDPVDPWPHDALSPALQTGIP